MKYLALSSVVTLMLAATGLCAEPVSSDIEVISVVPRSPDVQPIAMSVPANGRRETATFVSTRARAPLDSENGRLAGAESPKLVPMETGKR